MAEMLAMHGAIASGYVSSRRGTSMHRNIFRIVLALAAATFVLTVHAQDVARMDQVVREFVDKKQFMGTVLVARGDEIVFNRAYGSANLEWNVANTPDTKFRLGSVTKQFTGVSILLLEERGKLKLDDPIKKYYADAPAAWDAVTLKHLLTHTSGIPNLTSFPEFSKFQRFPATLADSIALFKDKPLEFVPGERRAYSNSGYILLGQVIEKVAGVPYAEFLRTNIFMPLGMKDSGYDSNTRVIEHKAAGYAPSEDGGMVNADFIHMSIPHAAGALYSTTGDLLRWQRGLYGGKILSAASLQKFTTPFREDYGLGIHVTKLKHTIYSHGGGIEGFNTFLMYYQDSGVTVVALSNLNGDAPDAIAEKLGAMAHGENPPASPHVSAMGAGAAAQVACGAVFVSGFATAQAEQDVTRLAAPITQGIEYKIDRNAHMLTASKSGVARTALYRPGLGCTLLVDTDAQTLQKQAVGVAAPKAKARGAVWPAGDRVESPAPANVDTAALARALDDALRDETPAGEIDTRALVVVHGGRIIGERYANGYSQDTRFLGWSSSKSVTAALVGTLVTDGKLTLDAAASVPAWQGADDPRHAITLRHLLTMSSGTDFREGVYGPGDDSTVMLFERGDMAGYAATKPAAHAPDSVFSYSSGTTNILARIVFDATGGTVQASEAYARRRLFEPAGMSSAVFERDGSGVVVGSSYFYATARDWARFGLLHLNRGEINGHRLLSPEWVDFVRAPSKADDQYGGQFWRNDLKADGARRYPGVPEDAYFALGHNTQIVAVIPSRDTVIVRLGWTTGQGRFDMNRHFAAILAALRGHE
jgi:CubicO group peptidase (beta-lactamase class C family)